MKRNIDIKIWNTRFNLNECNGDNLLTKVGFKLLSRISREVNYAPDVISVVHIYSHIILDIETKHLKV
jgi:hypothetical protein